MTAVPTWDIVGPTDAQLVCAAAAGDRGAFAGIYDRYADRLHDFCMGMLRDRDGAADCVQDAPAAAELIPYARCPKGGTRMSANHHPTGATGQPMSNATNTLAIVTLILGLLTPPLAVVVQLLLRG